jgi:hypothetical protein
MLTKDIKQSGEAILKVARAVRGSHQHEINRSSVYHLWTMRCLGLRCEMLASLRARKALRGFGAVLAVLLLCSPLFSQLNTGRISGAITDQSGGAIAGATVSVIDVARGETRPLTTDGAGLYAAPNLLPGVYEVRVEFMGFQTVDRQNVQVGAGGDVRVDVSMMPGQQNQTVTVTESIPIVNATNAQTGGTLQQNMIAELPFNGRNYRWMVEYVPGIMTTPGEGTTSSSTNGSGTDWANFMVDGLYDQSPYSKQSSVGGAGEAGDTTIMPLDAVQEVALVENPKAEYGWDPGMTMNAALKSGTNSLHGSAFAFGRNQDLDARNPFLFSSTGAPERGPVSFEQFGGSLGGPIKKDKLFFMVGEESVRVDVTSDFVIPSVPTTNNTVGTVGTPGLGIPASIAAINAYIAAPAGNGIPPVALNQLSLNMVGCGSAASLAGVTVPTNINCAGNAAGFQSLYADSSTNTMQSNSFPQYGGSNNVIGKIDYHLSDHHTLNGSYFFGQYHEYADASSAITQPYWDEVLGVRSQMVRGVEIWTPNSNWLNEIRGGWDHDSRPVTGADCSVNGAVTDPLGLTSPVGQFGAPNYTTAFGLVSGTNVCGNPTIKLSGVSAVLGFANNRDNFESDVQGTDSVSYTHGTHQFKFGVDARFESFNGVKVQDSQRGTVTFGGGGVAAFPGASALEDFLVGEPSSETIKLGNPIRTVRWDLIALFAQDDWRILPRLTLNLGLRWELETPAKDDGGQLANFNPATPSGMIQNNQLWPTQSDFSPHLGLAWDVTGKGTTTVRTGVGVAYAIPQLQNWITSQTDDMSAMPTGATLYGMTGTTIQGPGNITNILKALAPVSQKFTIGGKTSTDIISNGSLNPWGAGQALFNVNQFTCGDGLGSVNPSNPPTGPGGANPVNPSPCIGYAGGTNFHLPQMITWNLNVQHAFTNTLSLDLGYIGSHTSDISALVDLNEPTLGASGASTEMLRRPYIANCPVAQGGQGLNPSQCFPWFSQILSIQDAGGANYAAFQAYLNQRPARGVTYTVGYTLSHALGLQGGPGTGTGTVLNIACLKCEYGNLNTDALHHFSLTATYDIPGRKAPGQLLEGWAVNSSVNFLSGLPLNALDSTDDPSGTGENIDRWDLYGNAKPFDQILGGAGQIPCFGIAGSTFAKQANCTTVALPTGQVAGTAAGDANFPAPCLAAANAEQTGPGSSGQNGLQQLAAIGCYMVNGSAMVAPTQGTFGNMTRNELRGKGFRGWNASITKEWKFKERLNAQFRAEAFNLLNRTQYASAGANLGAPNTFGESTNTPDVSKSNPVVGSGGPREIQFGLKLTF